MRPAEIQTVGAARSNSSEFLPHFCLDHTKFGRQSVSPLCELDLVDTIVTDSQAPQELVAGLRERGVEVVVASATQGNGAG